METSNLDRARKHAGVLITLASCLQELPELGDVHQRVTKVLGLRNFLEGACKFCERKFELGCFEVGFRQQECGGLAGIASQSDGVFPRCRCIRGAIQIPMTLTLPVPD